MNAKTKVLLILNQPDVRTNKKSSTRNSFEEYGGNDLVVLTV